MGQYARLYPDTHNHARGSTIRACPLCPNWNARGWSACRSAFRKRIQNRLQHHTVQTAKSGHIISLYTNNILCTFQLTLLTIKQPYKSSETIWVEFFNILSKETAYLYLGMSRRQKSEVCVYWRSMGISLFSQSLFSAIPSAWARNKPQDSPLSENSSKCFTVSPDNTPP